MQPNRLRKQKAYYDCTTRALLFANANLAKDIDCVVDDDLGRHFLHLIHLLDVAFKQVIHLAARQLLGWLGLPIKCEAGHKSCNILKIPESALL